VTSTSSRVGNENRAARLGLDARRLQELIHAAGGTDAELAGRVSELGPAAVAASLVDEIVFRCAAPSQPREVVLTLDLEHGAELLTYSVKLAAGRPVQAWPGTDERAAFRFGYELAELARELYGPDRGVRAGNRRTELQVTTELLRHGPDNERERLWNSVAGAVDLLLSAISPRGPDLGALSVRFASDKWGALNWFTPHYEHHFARLRDLPVCLLEIGIGGYQDPAAGGGSLLMWKHYFHRGQVFGLDIFPKPGLDAPRLRTLQGDQTDPSFLAALASEHGPFDVVIDDGSHVNDHILTSFHALFPHVRQGGVYVIEDLWTAYCPGYGGDDRDLARTDTSMGLLKWLLDALHYEERASGRADAARGIPGQVAGLHVYRNIAFIEKGVNAQGGTPSWVPRSPHY
jgi:hypothetical protein